MNPRTFCLAASLLCAAAWQAPAQTLSVGDDAPPITVSRWAKGEKIERLEKDRTYVVEFWATWCGPCRTSIPHLTDLQKKYKDKGVQFVGVSVCEQDQASVDPFVKEMGDKMDYSVALDEVPKGEDGNKGKMAAAWMTASESNGIPTAFIVRGSKIAWIGHPMSMDAPLEKIAAPDFDIKKAASAYREEQALKKKMMAVLEKIQALGPDAGDKKQLAVVDKAIAAEPGLETLIGLPKYQMMVKLGDAGASAYANKLVDGALKDNAESLNQISWSIVDPDATGDRAKRDMKLALRAARQADELTHHENGAILDTLALAYFENGDAVKALAAQEKAVKLMGDDNDGVKERLEKYRKAAGEKKP